jgi:RNA polymerase sigma-70 factor (ECF subfamily)
MTFEEELQKAWPAARGAALKVLGPHREQADDMLQAAALKAWLHYEEFEGRSRFSTWFYRIVVNECLMLLRKVRPLGSLDEPWLDGLTVGDTLPTPRPDPLAQVLGKERRERLAREILNLSPKLRAAILRHTQGEVVRGKACNTEKANRFRARQRLRQALTQGGS